MTLQNIIAVVFFFIVLTILIVFLWGIIRYGIVREFRMRGWQDRLTRPFPEEIEDEWEIQLPAALKKFYQRGVPEQFELYQDPSGVDSTERWLIGDFIPLTVKDTKEWIVDTNLPGIPIAHDGTKGIYYLPFEPMRSGNPCPVLHRDLGGYYPLTDTVVASTVEDFVQFQVVETDED